jgi:hypothetical protein
MEEHDQPELTDPELDALLKEWRTPGAPSRRLRAAVFQGHSAVWYRGWLGRSIRIPVPVAVILCVLLVFAGWQWGARRARTQADVLPGFASTPPTFTFHGFSPVAELQPRIIRSHHATH